MKIPEFNRIHPKTLKNANNLLSFYYAYFKKLYATNCSIIKRSFFEYKLLVKIKIILSLKKAVFKSIVSFLQHPNRIIS